jgi:PPOX class probable F420-dependent enzyme
MATMDDVKRLGSTEQGLCVVATTRRDGSVHATVVNAGAMNHPVTGSEVMGFVAQGSARKVTLMRAAGRASLTFHREWRWAGVEGPIDIVDADDPTHEIELAPLLRAVFQAAGGTHDNWDEFDRVMADERRVALFISPERVIGQA